MDGLYDFFLQTKMWNSRLLGRPTPLVVNQQYLEIFHVSTIYTNL